MQSCKGSQWYAFVNEINLKIYFLHFLKQNNGESHFFNYCVKYALGLFGKKLSDINNIAL